MTSSAVKRFYRGGSNLRNAPCWVVDGDAMLVPRDRVDIRIRADVLSATEIASSSIPRHVAHLVLEAPETQISQH